MFREMDVGTEVSPIELEKRISRLEKLVIEDKKLERFEFKVFRIFVRILFIVALAGVSVWAFSEFAGFVIERFSSLWHALGW